MIDWFFLHVDDAGYNPNVVGYDSEASVVLVDYAQGFQFVFGLEAQEVVVSSRTPHACVLV